MLRLALVLAALLLPLPAAAAPKADPWPRWERHDPGSTLRVDHETWRGFLAAHVRTQPDGSTAVTYGAVDAAGRASLDAYLAAMQGVRVSLLPRPEQLAYWINLYNALTVAVILDHYPVASIRDIDISPGLFSDGPWGAKLATVEGEQLSLDDVEHRILRPVWRDSRIHYAVNCASRGCPDLRPEPFEAGRIDRQLDEAAAAFVNHPRGVSLRDGRLTVSSIYRWFVEDFGGDERGVLRHLRAYASPGLVLRLQEHDTIDGYDYDWSLNGAPPEG